MVIYVFLITIEIIKSEKYISFEQPYNQWDWHRLKNYKTRVMADLWTGTSSQSVTIESIVNTHGSDCNKACILFYEIV